MTPDDRRHGTNAGYIAGCRGQSCRDAHARYKKNLRTRRYLTHGRLKVDATGTLRRLEALAAMGWSTRELDRQLGRRESYVQGMLRGTKRRNQVLTRVADDVAALYDRLSMQIPPTTTLEQQQIVTRTRRWARAQGWVPPLAWDDADLDNPAATPAFVPRGLGREFDETVVQRILDGNWHARSTREDRVEVVRRWRQKGHSLRSLAQLTGWKTERYYTTSSSTGAAA